MQLVFASLMWCQYAYKHARLSRCVYSDLHLELNDSCRTSRSSKRNRNMIFRYRVILLPFLFRRLRRLVQVPGLFCWVHYRMSYRWLPYTRQFPRASSLRNGSKAFWSSPTVGRWSRKCRNEAYHTARWHFEHKTHYSHARFRHRGSATCLAIRLDYNLSCRLDSIIGGVKIKLNKSVSK